MINPMVTDGATCAGSVTGIVMSVLVSQRAKKAEKAFNDIIEYHKEHPESEGE